MRWLLTVAPVVVFALVVPACDDDGQSTGSSSSSGSTSSSGAPGPGRAISGEPKNGIATFYDADGSGNCSFDKTPGDLDVTALALPEYAASAACGSCLLVKGPKGEVTVRVVDSCPGCEGNKVNLDLSAEAFAKIAEPKDGRVSISYQLVSCSTSGNVAYHFKDGSSQYWTAIQIRNHRLPIAKVEYKKSDAWVAMNREDYNYFVESKGVGKGGVTLRVTAGDGQTIEDTLSEGVQADTTVTGTQQFK